MPQMDEGKFVKGVIDSEGVTKEEGHLSAKHFRVDNKGAVDFGFYSFIHYDLGTCRERSHARRQTVRATLRG